MDRFGLASEFLDRIVGKTHERGQNFESHQAFERYLFGLEDGPHPALADFADDPEITDYFGWSLLILVSFFRLIVRLTRKCALTRNCCCRLSV